MSGRFVAIPADRLLGELRAIGASVEAHGGRFIEGKQGREVVVDVVPPGGRAMVRVYTSLAVGATNARECGEDAVRVLVGVDMPTKFQPLTSSRKILRTAPADAADRIAAFLERLRGAIREAYDSARRTPCCHLCGRAMAKRATRDKSREFLGCIGYPECKATRGING